MRLICAYFSTRTPLGCDSHRFFKRSNHRLAISLLAILLSPHALAENAVLNAIITPTGEQVRLLPDGRWEYVDTKKRDVMNSQTQHNEEQKNQNGMIEQGQLFGIGRKIQAGDKDYNRGTLNPKMR